MRGAALGEFREAAVRERLWETLAQEKSYFAETQALKSLAKQGDATVERLIDEALGRDSWNDVLRSGALEALTLLRSPKAVDVLIRHTAYGVPHTRRMTAIRCLAQLGGGREDVLRRLTALLDDPYLLVQMSAVRALGQVGDERAVPALEKLTKGDWDGRLIRTAEETVLKLKKNIDDSPKPNRRGGGARRRS